MGFPSSIVTRVAIAARNSTGGPARCFNTGLRVVIVSSAVVDDVDLTGNSRRHHYLVVARVIIDDAAVRHISVHLGQIEFSDIDINTPGVILVAMHRAAKMILKAPLPNDIARWVYLHQFVRPQRFYIVANTLLRGAEGYSFRSRNLFKRHKERITIFQTIVIIAQSSLLARALILPHQFALPIQLLNEGARTAFVSSFVSSLNAAQQMSVIQQACNHRDTHVLWQRPAVYYLTFHVY